MVVLGFCGLVGLCDIKDVGDVSEWGEFCNGVVFIGDVVLDVIDRMVVVLDGLGVVGDVVDFLRVIGGVGEGEDFGEVVIDYVGNFDD